MAKTNTNLSIGYSTNTIKPAGKPVGSGNAGQDLVNKIRKGEGPGWSTSRW